MNTDLLDLWRTAAKDPDDQAVLWLKQGAPAGIRTTVESCSIFPEYAPEFDEPTASVEELGTPDGFVNYEGVEQSEEAAAEMKITVLMIACVAIGLLLQPFAPVLRCDWADLCSPSLLP